VKKTFIPTSLNRNLIYKTIAIASLTAASSAAMSAPAPCGPIVVADQDLCYTPSAGDLTITAGVTVGPTNSPFAVNVATDLTGTLTNSGVIVQNVNSSDFNDGGIRIEGDIEGSIVNEGLIQASGTQTTGGSYTAYMSGISGDGVDAGSIINNGTIDVDIRGEETESTGGIGINVHDVHNGGLVSNELGGLIDVDSVRGTQYSAYAIGIIAEAVYAGGQVNNSGTINITATATETTSGYAYANGIYVTGSVYDSGQITNTGLIDVDIKVSAYGYANGIYVYDEVYDSAVIENEGTINASVVAKGDGSYEYAHARGILIYSAVYGGGRVENSGTIDVYAEADYYGAYGQGIVAYEGVYDSGEVINSDLIDVEVNYSSSDAGAYGAGIFAYGNVYDSAKLINEGTIKVAANVVSSNDALAKAKGITIEGVYSGGLVENSGLIDLKASGDYEAKAFGIKLDGFVDGAALVINSASGTINAEATIDDGSSYAWALGIFADDNVYGTGVVTNDGDIDVKASAVGDTGSAFATGMYVSGNLYDGGQLVNGGTIVANATVEGASESAYARGIYVDTVYGGGSITNSGSIEVSASGANANATGILIDALDQSGAAVINSGTIRATANGASAFAYSLNINNGKGGTSDTGLVVNAVGGLLDGDLLVGGLVSVSNSGTIIAGGSIGGDYDVSATGTHLVDGVSASDYSQLVVGGTATFDDGAIVGVNVDTDLAEYVAGGETYDNVISAGTLSVAGSLASDTGSIIWEAGAVDDGLNGIDVTVGLVEEANIAIGDVINEGSQFALRVPDTGGAAPVTINNAGTIDGAVSLGDSVLNLQGNSSLVNGDVTGVAGSIVNVDGTFASAGVFTVGGFNINSGGDFTQGHTITSAVRNEGTLNIAAGTKATIDGSYTQGDDGVLSIGVNSASDYGQLEVSGAADLSANSTVTLKVSVDETLSNNETLEDVVSAGSLTVGTIEVVDDSLFWDFKATVDGSTIDITTDRGITALEAIQAADLGFAEGVARVIDELIAGGTDGDLNELISALDSLEDPEELVRAVAQLVPILIGQGSQVAKQIIGQIGNLVSQRMSSGRVKGGVSSGDPMMADAHVWAKVLGTKAEQGEIDGIPGYDADSYSFTLGFDGDINDDTLVGLAFTYSEADIDGDTIANSQMDIEGYQLTGYASYTLDESAFVDVLVTVGSNSNETSRQVNIDTINLAAKADYDSWFTRVYSAIGRDYQVNEQLTITPMLSLGYTYIDEDSYTEKGLGDVGLDVEGRDEESAVAGLEILGVYDVDDQNRITTHVGMGYEMLSDSTIVSSSFIGGGSVFKTEGPDRDPENYRFGVGYELNASDSLELRVNYDYEAADEYDNQILSATARWMW
jgi:uncharacterized protein with beta-barrel porin domain